IAIGIVGYNGWLVFRRIDVRDHTLALLRALGAGFWIAAAIALLKLAAATIGVLLVLRVVRVALSGMEAPLNRWDQLRDNDRSLAVFFGGVKRAVVVTAWMLLGVFALRLLHAPETAATWAVRAIGAYLVIAVGLLLIRASVVIVDTLDGFSHR